MKRLLLFLILILFVIIGCDNTQSIKINNDKIILLPQHTTYAYNRYFNYVVLEACIPGVILSQPNNINTVVRIDCIRKKVSYHNGSTWVTAELSQTPNKQSFIELCKEAKKHIQENILESTLYY